MVMMTVVMMSAAGGGDDDDNTERVAQQPNVLGSNELGTNIWLLEHLRKTLV